MDDHERPDQHKDSEDQMRAKRVPRTRAHHLTLHETHHEETCEHELPEGVPDLRVSSEQHAALTAMRRLAIIDIEHSPMEPKFIEQLIGKVALGVGGRGMCFRYDHETVRLSYMVANDDQETLQSVDETASSLLRLFNLGRSALATREIVEVPARRPHLTAVRPQK